MNEELVVENIKHFLESNDFSTWEGRERAKDFMRRIGFELWANTWRQDYEEVNEDEEIWGAEFHTENGNGQLLVLINWIDGFFWIYKKEARWDVGGGEREERKK